MGTLADNYVVPSCTAATQTITCGWNDMLNATAGFVVARSFAVIFLSWPSKFCFMHFFSAPGYVFVVKFLPIRVHLFFIVQDTNITAKHDYRESDGQVIACCCWRRTFGAFV